MSDREVLTAEDVKELEPYYKNVVLALRQVYDPELPVNVYDLGLIYDIHISKSKFADIEMTFTMPNCPMADKVLRDVREAVEDVPGITGCKVNVVFEPEWSKDMMSEEALMELGMI